MNNKIMPKTALLSVSDKSGLVTFGRFLKKKKIKIIATGGTAKTLRRSGVPVVSISSVTGFPEIFGGRVKSMHPKVAGGILGQRDTDKEEAKKNKIDWIDLVICNLYPFSEIVGNSNVLIMPSQHSAAISYKMIKSMSRAKVIGPLLIGLGLPIEIAPLRTSTSEIINLASIAAYSSDVIDYKKN